MPLSRHHLPISRHGCRVPVSLFAAITETKSTFPSRIPWESISPVRRSTGIFTRRSPGKARDADSRTEGCSTAEMANVPPLIRLAKYRITALFDSVAPEVNTTRSGSSPHPRKSARASRRSSSLTLAVPASRYRLDGLCQQFSATSSQARPAARLSGLVAL